MHTDGNTLGLASRQPPYTSSPTRRVADGAVSGILARAGAYFLRLRAARAARASRLNVLVAGSGTVPVSLKYT